MQTTAAMLAVFACVNVQLTTGQYLQGSRWHPQSRPSRLLSLLSPRPDLATGSRRTGHPGYLWVPESPSLSRRVEDADASLMFPRPLLPYLRSRFITSSLQDVFRRKMSEVYQSNPSRPRVNINIHVRKNKNSVPEYNGHLPSRKGKPSRISIRHNSGHMEITLNKKSGLTQPNVLPTPIQHQTNQIGTTTGLARRFRQPFSSVTNYQAQFQVQPYNHLKTAPDTVVPPTTLIKQNKHVTQTPFIQELSGSAMFPGISTTFSVQAASENLNRPVQTAANLVQSSFLPTAATMTTGSTNVGVRHKPSKKNEPISAKSDANNGLNTDTTLSITTNNVQDFSTSAANTHRHYSSKAHEQNDRRSLKVLTHDIDTPDTPDSHKPDSPDGPDVPETALTD